MSGRELAKRNGYTIGTLYNVLGSHERLVLAINARTLALWTQLCSSSRHCSRGRRACVYDASRIRDLIQDQGATPHIPSKSNSKLKPCFSKRLYRERNLIERFFSKLQHFLRVATRYDQLAANFLAMVQLASIRLWLRAYGSTA